MNDKSKPTDNSTPKREYRSGQFEEIGSVPELTKGTPGEGRDHVLHHVPVPVQCKWGDAPDAEGDD